LPRDYKEAMSNTALVPPLPLASKDVQARLARMSDELTYAWERTNSEVLMSWAASVAGDFTGSLSRRVNNVGRLVGGVVVLGVGETTGAVKAYEHDRLGTHLSDRAKAARESLQSMYTRSRDAGSELVTALREDPKTVAPHLLGMVVTSILVSGGPDGDGGAPDLDLLGGIGAHRSLWTHSILMGATLETGFLALVRLVHLIHDNLPQRHDPKWDELALHSQNILSAANKGASVGLAYHFLVDGLVQPGTYHGLPFELPQEVHQALQVLNGAAEGVDAKHKDWLATAPIWVRKGYANWPWTQLGYVAVRSRKAEDHLAERQTKFGIDSDTREFLTEEEARLLEKYGTWMEGLTSGRLDPLTAEQDKFVRVAWGLSLPATSFEKAWTMYLTGKYVR
jgi:hypothetical protein